MKIIKNSILIVFVAMSIIACSTDEISTNNSTANLTVNPYQPNAAFDAQNKGVYVGSVISVDLNYHAKILINAGNDGTYSAKTTMNGVDYIYAGTLSGDNNYVISFSDLTSSSSFILDISNSDNPLVSNFTIHGIDAHMVLQKRSSNNRADVLIGNYADVNDPNFVGAFDVFTYGDPHPYNPVASKVSRVTNVAPGGAIFVDTMMETFDFAICTNDPSQTVFEPLMFVNNAGNSAHFYADNQTSMVAGLELTWQIFHFINDGYYIQFENVPGFVDGCYETATGLWGWNGRYGVINFDFFGNAPVSNTQSLSAVNAMNSTPIELTSEMIEAILNN